MPASLGGAVTPPPATYMGFMYKLLILLAIYLLNYFVPRPHFAPRGLGILWECILFLLCM